LCHNCFVAILRTEEVEEFRDSIYWSSSGSMLDCVSYVDVPSRA
jgi:hypothetical protein